MKLLVKAKSLLIANSGKVRFFLGMLGAYLASKVSMMSAVPVFAESDNPQYFNQHVDTSSDANDVVAKIFNNFVAPLQSLAAVILVLACIICGIKIGVSAMTGDPRGRTSSLMGIAFIIIAGVVIVHARAIVGMASGLQNAA